LTHRITLLQILSNILKNAAESIHRSARKDGKIKITACMDNEGMIRIGIQDNGKGIAHNRLEKIFHRGYSSKKHDVSGIGLHWCANAVAAINGRIYASSEGPDKGALFYIVIPKNIK